MPQSNLLELAKHGEPNAIATLMNAVLVPRGIIAHASLEDDSLLISLEAPKPLNQTALVQFVQKGLRQLGSDSIQHVKVHGQKFGDQSLSWTEAFVMYPERLSVDSSSEAPQSNSAEIAPLLTDSPEPSDPEEIVADVDRLTQDEESKSSFELSADKIDDNPDSLTIAAWVQSRWKRYVLPVSLVVVGGFVAGGSVAFWVMRSQNQTVAATAQDETPVRKQQEAEAYLKRMNQAQEEFYQRNKRFAGSLEELERSANVIARSYSYAYRLRVGKTSLISAIPRESGLKSYVGAVFPTTAKPESVICQTIKPSMQAPSKPDFSAAKKQAGCGARSSQLP